MFNWQFCLCPTCPQENCRCKKCINHDLCTRKPEDLDLNGEYCGCGD
jgi:hypothetical protein